MKKTLLIPSLIVVSGAVSYGQSLLAGFDFTNVSGTTASATFSDLAPADTAAQAGPFGSFSTTLTSPNAVEYSTNLTANKTITFDDNRNALDNILGDGSSFSFASTSGFFGTSANGTSFTFEVDTGGALYTDFIFSFAGSGLNAADAGSIDFEFSTDGTNYAAISTESLLGAASAGGSVFTLATQSATADNAFFRGTFSGLNAGEALVLDNVQIGGTAVPEPSTSAAIFGFAALAFVAARRRR
ncbi:MAG: PEP-CTERM sorting domain-containing protein [Coraliomargaritaceae bacterium]